MTLSVHLRTSSVSNNLKLVNQQRKVPADINFLMGIQNNGNKPHHTISAYFRINVFPPLK